MMFSKSAVFVTLVAAAQVAVATPPACLLAAVNTQQDPSDLTAVCKSSEVASTLKSACGSDYNTALSAFKTVCKGAGVSVDGPSKPKTTSKSQPKPTTSSKPKATTSGKSGNAGSGSSKPQPTGVKTPTKGGDTSEQSGNSQTGKNQMVTKTSSHSGPATPSAPSPPHPKEPNPSAPSSPPAPPTPSPPPPPPASTGEPATPAVPNENNKSQTGTGNGDAPPENAAGHLEAGTYMALVVAGIVAAF